VPLVKAPLALDLPRLTRRVGLDNSSPALGVSAKREAFSCFPPISYFEEVN
jgi:hypothetical protein